MTSPYKYKTTVINKTGKPLYFKIGPEEQPLLCQSTGQTVTNPASKDPGTYTVAKDTVGGTALSPLCDMAVLASTACSVTPTGDNVHGTTKDRDTVQHCVSIASRVLLPRGPILIIIMQSRVSSRRISPRSMNSMWDK